MPILHIQDLRQDSGSLFATREAALTCKVSLITSEGQLPLIIPGSPISQ